MIHAATCIATSVQMLDLAGVLRLQITYNTGQITLDLAVVWQVSTMVHCARGFSGDECAYKSVDESFGRLSTLRTRRSLRFGKLLKRPCYRVDTPHLHSSCQKGRKTRYE
jgi:hypothetical protein